MRNDNLATASNIQPLIGKHFVVATERWDTSNGIEQDITSRLQGNAVYTVITIVRIGGSNNKSEIMRVTLWCKGKNGTEEFRGITK
jgi:hypothetical protein